ncbi:MAG: type II secretion system F family protein [Devosiaceae bacterium]|nr:type II secretion system F family protein [Devosiaceae bacterium]
MSSLILALLAFISVGALGAVFVPSIFGNAKRVDKRINAYTGNMQDKAKNKGLLRTKENRRKAIQSVLDDHAQKNKKKKLSLKEKIFQSGMSISKAAYIRNAIIANVIFFIVLFLIETPIWFAATMSVAMAYVGAMWFLGFKKKKYQAKYLAELPNAVEAIVRGIKAGMPLNDSIKVVAKDVKEPVRSEFARVVEQQAIGKGMADSILVLYDRVPVSEVNFLVVVIAVQEQAGGNLAEALQNLSRVLRDRKKMKAKVKAMASEAKASAGIIGSLPFIVAILVSIASPGYLTPLFATPMGNVWLGIAAGMLSMGGFIMNKMIQFDY